MTLLDLQPTAFTQQARQGSLAASDIDCPLKGDEFGVLHAPNTSILVGGLTRTLVTPRDKQAGIFVRMETIGQRIKAERNRLGLSQSQLGKAVGITQQAIGQLETGATRETTLIAKIAQVLGVSAYWLHTGTGPKEPVEDHSITDRERRLIERLRAGSPDDWSFVEELVDRLSPPQGDGSQQ